jgi:hypothetical protein
MIAFKEYTVDSYLYGKMYSQGVVGRGGVALENKGVVRARFERVHGKGRALVTAKTNPETRAGKSKEPGLQ